jgi:hypothetical protein
MRRTLLNTLGTVMMVCALAGRSALGQEAPDDGTTER